MKTSLKYFFFFAILSSVVVNAGASDQCELPPEKGGKTFDRDKFSSLQIRLTWDESHFTAPNRHNPKNFTYIIHTVDHELQRSLEETMNYILNRTAASPCSTISTSVINQEKQGAFGEIGFILSVPSENILAAKSGDLYSKVLGDNRDPQVFHSSMIELVNRVGQLISLDQLIEESQARVYNEVLVQGRVRKPLSIIGIIAMHPQMGFSNESRYREAPLLAKKLNIPFIILNN